ncbi:MAG: tetratricopeptide repeat protein [Pseudomonadota bacterium]
MRSAAVFLISATLIGACSTSPNVIGPIEAIERAKHNDRVEREAKDYAQFAIARYAELTGDPITAAENYSNLLKQNQSDSSLADRAVFASLLVNDFEGAAKKASKIDPRALENADLTRLTLAIDAITSRRRNDAQIYLQGPWQSPFHSVIATSLLAWTSASSDPDGASALQANAGQNDPILSPIAQAMSGILLANQERPDKALAIFDELWQQNARFALAIDVDARLLAQTGDVEKALSRLARFRNEVGRHPALTKLNADLRTGALPEPVDLSPREGAALAIYAATAALADQSASDLPSVYFTLALELDPDLDAARTLSAKAMDGSGRFTDAERLLRAIPEPSIYHTSAQGQLAWVLRRQNKNAEALTLAKSTLERTNNRNIRIQLADLYQSLARDGEAEKLLTEIIEADKVDGTYDWRVYFARGASRERQGKWPPAENDLQTALGLNPENPTLLNYLGYSWVDRGEKLEDGLQLIEKALQLNPSSGAISDSLGWAHYKLGNYERAVFYLERATELEPQDPVILDHLGDTYWQVGRYTEAGYQWARALQNLDLDAKERPLIEAKLNTGLSVPQRSTLSATVP